MIRLIRFMIIVLAFLAMPVLAANLSTFSDAELLAMRNVCAKQHGHETINDKRQYDADFQGQCQGLDTEADRRMRTALIVPSHLQSAGEVANNPMPPPLGDPDTWFKAMLGQ